MDDNMPTNEQRRDTLRQLIADSGLSVYAFENKYGLSGRPIAQILTNKVNISYRVAYALSKCSDKSVEFWVEHKKPRRKAINNMEVTS